MAVFYVKSDGQGEPVVLVPGLGGLAGYWTPVMGGLKSNYRVSACDHPGVGQSAAEGVPSIPGIVKSIVEWMDAQNIPEVHVVGHSTGSLVAQTLGLDHRSRIKSMVLSSGWARSDQRFRDLFALRKLVLERLGGTAYSVLGNLLAFPSEWYGANIARTPSIGFDSASTLDVATTCARIDMLLEYTRIGELGSLTIPTLVVGAEDDFIVPFHHSQELARLIPGAILATLNGGHHAPITRTGEYVERLVRFWTLNE